MDYEHLTQNPTETMRQLCSYLGLGKTLTQPVESSLQDFLRQNPKHKHGKHRYSLHQFGLTDEEGPFSFYALYAPIQSKLPLSNGDLDCDTRLLYHT